VEEVATAAPSLRPSTTPSSSFYSRPKQQHDSKEKEMKRAGFTRFAVRTLAMAGAMVVASSRVRRQMLASAVVLVAVSVLPAVPALADTQTRNLTLHTVGAPQSVDVACLDDSCTMLQVTVTGTATSNLAGAGNVSTQADQDLPG
jgi:hypothetical protein